MAGGGRRDAEAAVRIGSGNVFAALEALKKKKKKPPASASSSSSSASGKKGKGGKNVAGAGEEAPAPPPVFWAPAPLKSKSWADVDDEDDEDYFATTAPPRPVFGTVPAAAGEGKAGAEEETESEDDGLDVDMGDDEPEEEPEHEHEVDVPSEADVKKSAPMPVVHSKDTERQLSKKELKKKELAELDAVLAELGISGNATQADVTSKSERKTDEQNGDGDKNGAPVSSESKSSKKKKSKKEKSLKNSKADEMALNRQRTVRFYDERAKPSIPLHQKQAGFAASKLGVASSGKNKIFVAGDELWYNKIFDPSSDFILTWNQIFLFSCFVALFIDPLYFYVPKIVSDTPNSCVGTDRHLAIIVTFFRSIADLLYGIHIIIKFRTAYINPSSTLGVFGRGDLITDPKEIAWKYLRSDFAVDVAAALPLPQIIVWFVIPAIKYSTAEHNNNILVLIVLVQYFPRLYLIFPLTYEIVKATGVVAKTAWQGAAYNLLLYMIASHVLGALWYLLSVDRQTACWKKNCRNETGCDIRYLDCDVTPDQNWASTSAVFSNCNAGDSDNISFDYGMFLPALSNQAPAQGFLIKYFYSLWWGLQNLSCYGQTLTVSTYIGETLYCIFLAVLGLVLFAHLIGNVQTYLQSITVRVEEWRLKQRDTEEWMRHRQLPDELRERVRRFIQYKWLATRGVNEESILQALPADLRRDIKRHLCLGLVRRVPFFSQMDDQLLDAICERLVSSLCTKGTYIVREGDPVTEMLFIIRGKLESSTTNGGRTGFFNSTTLKPGDFCGEELLGWALVPKPTVNLPSSTRTVKALIEVEAFALQAEDLKFVANQFRRLHSKRLQHTFRYYSHHWRTWASCFIQAAWRRYKRRKMAKDLSMRESFSSMRSDDSSDEYDSPPKQNLALKIMAGARKGPQKIEELPKIRKPDEPDFSAEPYE